MVRADESHDIVGFAASGNEESDGHEHGYSLVGNLIGAAQSLGVTPIGFANVIDSRHKEWERVRPLAEGIHKGALEAKVAVMNGEYAILGPRVADANAIGIMIATIPKGRKVRNARIPYARFSHEGLPITINADGVGTKTEFYERTGKYANALKDFLAMNLDDTSKFGGVARAVVGVVERRGDIPSIDAEAKKLEDMLGFPVRVRYADAQERIASFIEGIPAYNLSGAVISTVDEERLKNPPRSNAGEYLVGLHDPLNPNPRSNGISKLRELAWQSFGYASTDHWHHNPLAQTWLEFLSAPSTIFYPFFNQVLEEGSASAVYHMSGGAFNGKLAKPLAQQGLHAELDNLFRPDWRMLPFISKGGISSQAAYEMWHMGTEALVSTNDPQRIIEAAKTHGYEARAVGHITQSEGKGGARLTAFNNETVEYLYDIAA